MKLKIKPIKDWNARDFVNYFRALYESINDTEYRTCWGKDGVHFKKIQHLFSIRGRSNEDIIPFLKWAIKKGKRYPNKFGIGTLEKMAMDFFKLQGMEETYIEGRYTNEGDLDEDMKEWIKKIEKEKEDE